MVVVRGGWVGGLHHQNVSTLLYGQRDTSQFTVSRNVEIRIIGYGSASFLMVVNNLYVSTVVTAHMAHES